MRSMAHPQPRYRLADHVRACRVGGQIVMLDLNTSRYTGLAGSAVSSVLPESNTWPRQVGRASLAWNSHELPSGMTSWIGQGLLVDRTSSSPPAPLLAEPLESLNLVGSDLHIPPGCRHVISLWASAAVASSWLRRRSLAQIAGHVDRLRKRPPSYTDSVTAPLQAAVIAYLRARPFALTAHDRCLLDSLALIRFLAAKGFYPQWVIGVATSPFAAHSWVQCGHVVLNDAHENVRRHQPILVV